MIKPWLFEFLPELGGPSVEPDPRDVAALFARYLDLWARDEALGFEGIFFSEHHFGRSYSASPNLLIAALASRTKKLPVRPDADRHALDHKPPGVSSIARVSSTRADRARPMATQPPSVGMLDFRWTRGAVEIE